MGSNVNFGITATDEGFNQTLKQMEQNAAAFGNSMQKSGGKAKTLNGQLREAKKQAQELTMQWRALDDATRNTDFGRSLQSQLQEVLNKAGELQDIKADVANEIKNIASDTALWDGAKQGIGVLSSSMQSMAGVVGMLGGNTEAFTRALNAMKTVEAVTNTIIGIGNALQKDSALMTALRTLRTKTLTSATQQETAAIKSETSATNQQTIAQEANNAAVKANPYVAVAMAIVTLTTAIIAWCSATDEATETTESLNSAFDKQGPEIVDKIKLFQDLQEEYNAVKDDARELNKWIHENKEKFKHLGVEVRNADQAYSVFSKKTESFVLASDARAQALAHEISAIDTLGKAMSGLSRLYHKFLSGQEVDWKDLREEIQKLTNWDRGKVVEYMKGMGWKEESDIAFGNAVSATSDTNAELMAKTMADLAMKKLEEDRQAQEQLTKALKDQLAKIDKDAAELYNMMEDYTEEVYNEDKNTIKKTPKAKTSKKGKGKGSDKNEPDIDKDEDVQKLIRSWTGLNALISEATKKKNELDKTSPNYAKDFKRYEDMILMAEKLKFSMIDQSTSKGLEAAAQQIQTIIKLLPKGSTELEKWQAEYNKVQKSIYDKLTASFDSNDIDALQEVVRSTEEGLGKGFIQYSSDIEAYLNKLRKRIRELRIERGLEKAPETDFEQFTIDDKYKNDWKDLTRYVTEYGARAEQYAASVKKYEEELKAYNDAQQRYQERVASYEKNLSAFKKYNDLLEKRNHLIEDYNNERISEDKYNSQLDELNAKIKQYSEQIWGVDEASNSAKLSQNEFAAASTRLTEQLRQGTITVDEYDEKFSELCDRLGMLDDVIVRSFSKPIKPTIEMPKFPNSPLSSMALEEIFPSLDNIPSHIQQLIQATERKLQEDDLNVFVRAEIADVNTRLQQRLDEVTKGKLTIKAQVEPSFIMTGSDWDMRKSYENQSQKIQQISDDYARGIIKTSNEAREQIAALNRELVALGMNPITVEIKTEGQQAIENMQGYLGTFNDTVVSTVDSIESLASAIDDGKTGWEIFKASLSTVEQLLNSVATVMQFLNTIQDIHNATKAVTNTLDKESAANKTEEAIAQASIASTSPAFIGAITAQASAAGTALAPLKALSSVIVELAAANMFNANSSIPIIGAAIGAANVAVMRATMAALKATDKFAQGGIVRGSTTMGDSVLVRANAGEMILSKSQQSHLFKMLNDGVTSDADGPTVTNVRIKGSDIILSLRNYAKVNAKNKLVNILQ